MRVYAGSCEGKNLKKQKAGELHIRESAVPCRYPLRQIWPIYIVRLQRKNTVNDHDLTKLDDDGSMLGVHIFTEVFAKAAERDICRWED